MSTDPKRRGRRKGGSSTDAEILDAARKEFAQHGFGGSTVRGIAQRAGVDHSLVLQRHRSKEQLFAASIGVDDRLCQSARQAIAEGPGTIGCRVVRFVLDLWDSSEGPALRAMLANSATNPAAAAAFRQSMNDLVAAPVEQALGRPLSTEQSVLVGTQLVGLVTARYLSRIEPMVALSCEYLVETIGPTVDRYLEAPRA